MFEILQGINPMVLIASLAELKKKSHIHENVTIIITMKQKKSRDIPNGPLCQLE